MADEGYTSFSGKRKTKNDKKKQRGYNKYKRGGQFRTREKKLKAD